MAVFSAMPTGLVNQAASTKPATPTAPGSTFNMLQPMQSANAAERTQASNLGLDPAGWNAYTSAIQRYPQYGQALGIAQQMAAPQMTGFDLMNKYLNTGGDISQQQYLNQQAALRSDTNFRLASNDISGQQLGLDRQGVGIDNNYWNALLGGADRQYGIDMNKAGYAQDVANFGRQAEADASGSQVSAGNRFKSAAISRQYGIDTQQAGLTRDMSKARPTRELGQNQLQLKGIDLKAKQLGLDSQQLRDQLTLGLQKLYLGNQMNVNDLNKALTSNDIQKQNAATNIINQVLQWASLGALGQPTPPPAPPPPQPYTGEPAKGTHVANSGLGYPKPSSTGRGNNPTTNRYLA